MQPTSARSGGILVHVGRGQRARQIILTALTLCCAGVPHTTWAPPEAAGRIYREAEVDQPPRLIRMPSPGYPPELLRREVPGRVEVEYVVDSDGRVEPASIRVVTTTHGDFARAATAAVKEAVYEPGTIAGTRVRVRITHVLQFRVRPH
jgi:protein TonB